MVRPEELHIGDFVKAKQFGYGIRRDDGIIEVGYSPLEAQDISPERAVSEYVVIQMEPVDSHAVGIHDTKVRGLRIRVQKPAGLVPVPHGEILEFYGTGWFRNVIPDLNVVKPYVPRSE